MAKKKTQQIKRGSGKAISPEVNEELEESIGLDAEVETEEEEEEERPELGFPENELEQKVKQYLGCYWKSTTHITGFGTVNGKATRSQLQAFIGNINPESDLDKWLSKTDTFTEEVKKMRKRKPQDT